MHKNSKSSCDILYKVSYECVNECCLSIYFQVKQTYSDIVSETSLKYYVIITNNI